MARQPVLDRRQEVFAYDLRFCPPAGNGGAPGDPDRESFQVLHTALLGFGLDTLLGQHPGCVIASRDVLLQEFYLVLPRDRAVIMLAESVEESPEILEACRAAKRAGYRLGIQHPPRMPVGEGLAGLADIVRVDVRAIGESDRQALARRLGGRRAVLIAEGVDTQAQFRTVRDEGFSHFQGFFFCEPELMATMDVPAFKRNCVRFMAELQRPELDFDRLEPIIRQEMALTVKLLRFLNSAGFGWRYEVTSIRHALRVLGERAARKWCYLMAVTVLGEDRPAPLVVTSMVRAQFAELVGRELGMGDRAADLFLTGTLSTLDGLLGRPMSEALEALPLASAVRDTLLGRPSTLSPIWQLVMAYERADWTQLRRLAASADLSIGRLPGLYRSAVQWVDRLFSA